MSLNHTLQCYKDRIARKGNNFHSKQPQSKPDEMLNRKAHVLNSQIMTSSAPLGNTRTKLNGILKGPHL